MTSDVSLRSKQMDPTLYRDMHLLTEVTKSPEATQRELSKRIGVALGLTNLMLRRLAKKGYIKIAGTKRNRIRYLITPTGLLEKSRLTCEFIQYSLQLYSRVRYSLRKELAVLAQTGNRRVLLYGTGELAEIAFLVIREIGLDLVGVVDLASDRDRFLGHPVQRVGDVAASAYDRMIVPAMRGGEDELHQLVACGVPPERMILLPMSGVPMFPSEQGGGVGVPLSSTAEGSVGGEGDSLAHAGEQAPATHEGLR